ncbi:hypothetical protein TNCT_542131 [Trichonephila clavata]|uniref:Uncharacterized protein n=1 Tax=Trichonephila clavata TaxID=2740835 RepID=A0A8X6HRJ3_TRICU|nr:hypothetical protein TNCT_542131 [Trichonephila clavata]
MEFIGQTQHFLMVLSAPYSPVMAQCNFWVFPKLKISLNKPNLNAEKDYAEHDDPFEKYHKQLTPEVFPTIAGLLENSVHRQWTLKKISV